MVLKLRRSIVLASRSPQRLKLAIGEGWAVTVMAPPEAVEANAAARGKQESVQEYVQRLAQTKAEAVVSMGITGTILACDTLSEISGLVLGKPCDRQDARKMLLKLSGKRHRVFTGVCLWQSPQLAPLFGVAESVLEMAPITNEILQWYLASGLWQGKAGACGFQDENLPLTLIAGSPSNVVGLPLETVQALLTSMDQQLAENGQQS